jgi:hypothetical protein
MAGRPRPARCPQRRRRRDDPGPRAPLAPAAGDSPAAAALAALSAEPAGATVAVIAARTGTSMPAARQALLAHEKNGTATRIKGSGPGIADTWTRAAPLGRRPHDPRHAAVSLWLNSGVPATEVARRAGHGVAVLLKTYVHCIDGQANAANQRITDALSTPEAEQDPGRRGRRRQRAGSLKRQVTGQKAGGTVSVTAPTPAVRAPSVDFKAPGTRGHGRIADGGSPETPRTA